VREQLQDLNQEFVISEFQVPVSSFKIKASPCGATGGMHGDQIKYFKFLEFKGGTHDSI